MVADLGRSYSLVGRTAGEVERLLGPSECYLIQDGEPCYNVQISGARFYLMLPVTRSGPRPWTVLKVRLSDDLTPRGGCFFL